MFCTKCGAQLPDGSAFCNLCGAQLNAVNVPPSDNPYSANAPTGVSSYSANAPTGVSSRSAIAYFLFAWFLGCFGAHNFYIGKTGLAVTQLLVAIIGGIVLLGIPTIVIAIWVMVEGCMGLAGKVTDADGLPLAK